MFAYDIGTISLTGNYVTWQIKKFFSLRLIPGIEINSQQFVYGDSRYSLFIWPRGRKGSGKEEWFGICLYKYDKPRIGDSVQFSIVAGSETFKTCTVKCSEHKHFKEERFMEWTDFCTLSHKIAPFGCLTIVCRLLMQNGKSFKENDNVARTFDHPINNPPVKYKSDDYDSPDPLSATSSFKLKSPKTQISSLEAPGTNYGHPSTINLFTSTSFFENSFESIPESTETQNSDFKMPYDATGATAEDKTRNICTSGLAQISEKNKPEIKQVPAKDSLQNTSSKLLSDTRKCPTNALNSPEKSNGYKVASSTNGLTDDANSSPRSTLCGELSTCVHHSKGLKILSQQLKNLYLSGKEYDLTIVMDGKEFKVLKSILKFRSPTFASLLSEDLDKNTSDVISIDPFGACNASVFHDFLIYVYSGEIENLSHKIIKGLYCAACKFEMPDLKEECVTFLKTSLSIDTITDILRIINEESDFVNEAVVFLAKNLEVIMDTDEWKQFMREEFDRAYAFHLKALKIGYTKTLV